MHKREEKAKLAAQNCIEKRERNDDSKNEKAKNKARDQEKKRKKSRQARKSRFCESKGNAAGQS